VKIAAFKFVSLTLPGGHRSLVKAELRASSRPPEVEKFEQEDTIAQLRRRMAASEEQDNIAGRRSCTVDSTFEIIHDICEVMHSSLCCKSDGTQPAPTLHKLSFSQ
jgi:hypothetical protein